MSGSAELTHLRRCLANLDNSVDGDSYSYLEPVDCAHAVQK